MSWVVSSTVECVPSDPVGEAVAAAIAGVMGSSSLEILGVLPDAGLQVAARFAGLDGTDPAPLSPALHRAVRDMIVVEALGRHRASAGTPVSSALFAETIEFLIELSGT